MIILEGDADPAAYAPLREIPHLDVFTMLWPRSTLEYIASLYAPDIEPRLRAYMIERFLPHGNLPERLKMTKARVDVERTYASLIAVENDPDLPAKIQSRYLPGSVP